MKLNWNIILLLTILVVTSIISLKYIETFNVSCYDSLKTKLESDINSQTTNNYKYIYPQGSNTLYENPKSLPAYKWPWYPFSWKKNVSIEDIAHLDCNGSPNQLAWDACYKRAIKQYNIKEGKDGDHIIKKDTKKQHMQRVNDLALGIEPFCCGNF